MRSAGSGTPALVRTRRAGEDLAPSGFEPLSPAPKASMLGHYTTGLRPDAPEDGTKSSRWRAEETRTQAEPAKASAALRVKPDSGNRRSP
jgi:hypothetical protein